MFKIINHGTTWSGEPNRTFVSMYHINSFNGIMYTQLLCDAIHPDYGCNFQEHLGNTLQLINSNTDNTLSTISTKHLWENFPKFGETWRKYPDDSPWRKWTMIDRNYIWNWEYICQDGYTKFDIFQKKELKFPCDVIIITMDCGVNKRKRVEEDEY